MTTPPEPEWTPEELARLDPENVERRVKRPDGSVDVYFLGDESGEAEDPNETSGEMQALEEQNKEGDGNG